MNTKITKLGQSLSLLVSEGWIIESENNKIYLWHPEKEVFELIIERFSAMGWLVVGRGENKMLVFYL